MAWCDVTFEKLWHCVTYPTVDVALGCYTFLTKADSDVGIFWLFSVNRIELMYYKC